MELEISFTSFLLRHQEKNKRSLNFLILMESILTAAKQIRQFYSQASLARNLDEAGTENVQGESVMKMDLAAHEVIIHNLRESHQVIQAISEEVEERINLNKEDGRYFVYFDPLDGSSNIKHSLPVGFLFGIAKRNLEQEENFHLRSGKDYIASGMFMLPSGDFTFALKDAGTWRFIMDETLTYVRPTRLHFPDETKSWELSWNAGNRYTFQKNVQDWIAQHEQQHNFRYTGSLAVDFHRLIHNGGMFLYPAIVNHPDSTKNRPEGKLRLLYETNVIAMLAHEAGGSAIDEHGNDLLSIVPREEHERSAIYVGSTPLVESMREALKQ